MMRQWSRSLAFLIAMSALGSARAAAPKSSDDEKPRAENERIKIDEVPQEFLKVARETVPGAEWTHAEINHDYGSHESLTVYEITGTKGGMEVEVDIRADGSVEEVEEVLDFQAIPKPVMDLLSGEFPDFEVRKAEKSLRPYRNGSKAAWYEMKGTTKAGATIDVEISEDGKYYVVEAD